MLSADDIFFIEESHNMRFGHKLWKQSFHLSRSKTKYMYCSFSKKQEEYKLEDGEDVIPQVSKFKFKFKYLGSINEKLWENE
ncbi:hypothetical protein GYH30_044631 [Glycine max]|uniref:Uncharacterized protein n=1 Tax=Glycine max TaxID=3847 RepID=A0A0R0FWG3_SOYBN|nr:hypothetical protein GYH30_044631 [Glycine max]